MKKPMLPVICFLASVAVIGQVRCDDSISEIRTSGGKVYKNLRIMSKTEEGVKLMHSDGVSFVRWKELEQAEAAKLGYGAILEGAKKQALGKTETASIEAQKREQAKLAIFEEYKKLKAKTDRDLKETALLITFARRLGELSGEPQTSNLAAAMLAIGRPDSTTESYACWYKGFINPVTAKADLLYLRHGSKESDGVGQQLPFEILEGGGSKVFLQDVVTALRQFEDNLVLAATIDKAKVGVQFTYDSQKAAKLQTIIEGPKSDGPAIPIYYAIMFERLKSRKVATVNEIAGMAVIFKWAAENEKVELSYAEAVAYAIGRPPDAVVPLEEKCIWNAVCTNSKTKRIEPLIVGKGASKDGTVTIGGGNEPVILCGEQDREGTSLPELAIALARALEAERVRNYKLTPADASK